MALRTVERELASLLRIGAGGRASDAELLAIFHADRGGAAAEDAFRLLMTRHGGMVWGVCRRRLRDVHAAEDAFQATFLILARKAGSVRVDGSLAPWLHGVGARVANRLRAKASSDSTRFRSIENHDPIDRSVADDPLGEGGILALVDEEIARLPIRYRTVVVQCRLEGRTAEEVARRLRCPVGTVHSRLHRGLGRLRAGLIRRGVGPVVASAALAPAFAEAELPPRLAASTLVAATAGTVSTTVSLLIHFTIRRMFLMKLANVGFAILGVGCVAAAALALPDDPKPAPAATSSNDKPKSTVASEFAKLKAEYDAKNAALREATEKIEDEKKSMEVYWKMAPNEVEFSRRMVEIALKDPADKSARDAFLWVLDKPFMSDQAAYADEWGRAAAALLRHHGDDPVAISIGLQLHHVPTARRDLLLHGFVASAKSRESKGIALAALARYLEIKSLVAKGARNFPERTKFKAVPGPGEPPKEFAISDDEQAYRLMLDECDSEYIKNKAVRLYEDVVKDYGDVPYLTLRMRALQDALAEPNPKLNGRSLTSEERAAVEARLKTAGTLGDFARGRLDDMANLAIGKPAPEIVGVDLEGKPLKLSDHRGKVVLISFWATWCGPCVREIPAEKALVEKMKGKPFVLLGVDADETPQVALDYVKKEKMTWPSWFDGNAERKIARLYHVEGIPMTYLIDAKGVIRQKHVLGDRMITEVEKLLAESAAKP